LAFFRFHLERGKHLLKKFKVRVIIPIEAHIYSDVIVSAKSRVIAEHEALSMAERGEITEFHSGATKLLKDKVYVNFYTIEEIES